MAENNRYIVTNSFSGGMNSDADKSVMPNNQYLYAENFRIFNDSTNTVGSLENILGNKILTAAISTGYYPVGACSIRDDLYICTTQNTHPTDGGYSELIKVVFASDGESIASSTIVYQDQHSSDGSLLNWSTDYKIKIIGRYESDTVKKIYFVDGYNTFRSMNVVNVAEGTPVNKFDVIPNFALSAPVFSQFVSGGLTSGKVQYAYQMYNLYGAETLFSPTSPLIPISETSGQTGSNKTFKGSDLGENTGKGIRFSITPPAGFDRIRVVSIKYNSLNAIPVINIIVDQDISTNPVTTYFYDFGTTSLGTYTYEEFAVVGREVFIASEIETKNNYLFVANVTDDDWDIDFDARAYRFVPSTATGTLTSGHAAIFDSGAWGSNAWYNIYSNFLIGGTTSVPETYDCINPYNDPSLDKYRTDTLPSWVHLYNFKYQSDGVTLGGEGTKVKYTFTEHEFTISDTGTVYNEDYAYNTDYSNVNIEIPFLGNQRDETYRYGLEFFDTKGRAATVKWIGDIRMPYYSDTYGEPFSNDGTTATGKALGLVFTINTASAYAAGARYFKIVRVKREADDRSILAQGVIPTTFLYTDGSGIPSYRLYTIPYTATATVSTINKSVYVFEFISPEVNFNKNLSYTSGDTLELIGVSNNVYQYDNFSNSSVTVGTLPTSSSYSHTFKYNGFYTGAGVFSDDTRNAKIKTITSAELMAPPIKYRDVVANDGINFEGLSYKVLNYIEGTSNSQYGPSGTKLIIYSDTFGTNISGSSYQSYYCNYKRNVFNSQYGGNTYVTRQSNSYIDCGTLQPCLVSGTSTETVYGGDTYIGMFDYLRNITAGDLIDGHKTQLIMYFPVETSINLRYRMDNCFSKTIDDPNHSRRYMQELAGVYTAGSITYTQETNLYLYNSVYSQGNVTIGYYPENSTSSNLDEVHDNRVLVSDLKIDRETSDSWTKFRMDNFLDIDSKYGEITSLLTKDNYLYFWQPRAFGVLSVNQRSVISDNNPGALVLGTGGVLDRYDYISTSYGATCRFSPVVGIKGLYWIDNTSKTICKYDGQTVEPISKSKGINSFISGSIELDTETISCYDKKYNEVLFTVPYTYTTSSGNSIQPGTYLITATDIPAWLDRPRWVTTSEPFTTIKNFRMVVGVLDNSGNSNYWPDTYISTYDTGTTTETKKYLRTGTNTFDFDLTSYPLQTRIKFGITNAGSGPPSTDPWTNPYAYKLLLDSIDCYEIVESLDTDEAFAYADGDIDTVTGGRWEKVNILGAYPEIYPITWEAVIDTNKLRVKTTAPTTYYSVRAVWPGIIPVGSTDVRVDITISEVDVNWPALTGAKCAIVFTDHAQIQLAPFSVGTFTWSNYGNPADYTLYIDPTKSYDLIIMLQDISSVPSAMSVTIDEVKVYSAQPSPTAFFSEDFTSFYQVPLAGDVPTGWQLYYDTSYGLSCLGYHAGGLVVDTIAPIVYNELLDSFNGMYTFNTDALSLFISPNNTNYITNYRWDLYMHNLGERNTFYGYKFPSTLKFIVNDNYNTIKTFDSFRYNSTCKTQTDDIDQYDITFATIRCYNDYQNSNFQTIYTSGTNANITRKEREFIMNVPRNRVNLAQPNYPDIFDPTNIVDETRLFKERMRDKYLITELVYNDTGNNKFNIPYVSTNYRISKR